MWKQKRAFFLHHRLHTSLSKVMMNGLGGDGLVLDILECLGNLNRIFSLSSAQKLNISVGVMMDG